VDRDPPEDAVIRADERLAERVRILVALLDCPRSCHRDPLRRVASARSAGRRQVGRVGLDEKVLGGNESDGVG
jgi:hypothetical protein